MSEPRPLHTSEHGTVYRLIHEGEDAGLYEVLTDYCPCLVSTDRDEQGEFYVDLPSNWPHTEEEGYSARHSARMALAAFMATLPNIGYRDFAETGEDV